MMTYKDREYRDLVHFTPYQRTWNVWCLNGSAHARRTTNMDEVTCPKCRERPKDLVNWWKEYIAKRERIK